MCCLRAPAFLMNFRYPVVDMLPLLYLYMLEQYQYNKMCPRPCDMYMDQTSPQAESCAKREKLGNISDLNFYWFNCGSHEKSQTQAQPWYSRWPDKNVSGQSAIIGVAGRVEEHWRNWGCYCEFEFLSFLGTLDVLSYYLSMSTFLQQTISPLESLERAP